eukprot:scaffold24060_cov50-Attheya_sp.AAC.10
MGGTRDSSGGWCQCLNRRYAVVVATVVTCWSKMKSMKPLVDPKHVSMTICESKSGRVISYVLSLIVGSDFSKFQTIIGMGDSRPIDRIMHVFLVAASASAREMYYKRIPQRKLHNALNTSK